MKKDHAGQARSSIRVEVAVHSPITPLENVVASVTANSNQPMPPENRGSATVTAHGTVDTTNTAAQVPDANRLLLEPALTISSTIANTSQLATPERIDIAQWTRAISVRLLPRVNNKS